MIPRKTSFAVALGITGFVGWALFAEEPHNHALGDTGMWVSARDPEHERICSPGFSVSIRPPEAVTQRLKREMMSAQSIPWSRAREFELDHVVPLCLGGAPIDPANLQLQPWLEARAKDERERQACRAYCAGDLSLEEAQALFHRSGEVR
jgi:hypothetical protein